MKKIFKATLLTTLLYCTNVFANINLIQSVTHNEEVVRNLRGSEINHINISHIPSDTTEGELIYTVNIKATEPGLGWPSGTPSSHPLTLIISVTKDINNQYIVTNVDEVRAMNSIRW